MALGQPDSTTRPVEAGCRRAHRVQEHHPRLLDRRPHQPAGSRVHPDRAGRRGLTCRSTACRSARCSTTPAPRRPSCPTCWSGPSTPTTPHPDSWIRIFSNTTGSLNELHGSVPQADALMDAGLHATNPATVQTDYAQAGVLVADSGEWISIADVRDVVVSHAGVSRLVLPAPDRRHGRARRPELHDGPGKVMTAPRGRAPAPSPQRRPASPARAAVAGALWSPCEDLARHVPARRPRVRAPARRHTEVAAGEILGLVGESGSGKSVLGLSLLGLLPTDPAPAVVGRGRGVRHRHGRGVSPEERRLVRRRSPGSGVPGPDDVAEPDHAGRPAGGRGGGPRPSAVATCSSRSVSPTPGAGWRPSRTSCPAACASG